MSHDAGDGGIEEGKQLGPDAFLVAGAVGAADVGALQAGATGVLKVAAVRGGAGQGGPDEGEGPGGGRARHGGRKDPQRPGRRARLVP